MRSLYDLRSPELLPNHLLYRIITDICPEVVTRFEALEYSCNAASISTGTQSVVQHEAAMRMRAPPRSQSNSRGAAGDRTAETR
ncbi:hypothetical protein C8Q77DRAFT_645739 [Trametes polyzona]|nr:hypothetical protein C8Q77DRAFT_645739 [Trametes polyzona]